MSVQPNVYDAEVVACDARDSHAVLRVDRCRLAVRAWPGMRKRAQVKIRIRPEDVVLCADPPGRVSARNVLPGHVRAVKLAPEGAYVTADLGFPLTALVTAAAVTELRLKRGAPVFALVKATAVVSEVDLHPRFSVSVRGPRGEIDHRHMRFLRGIASCGSMLGAARGFGITYRTAWMWVKEMNHAWGRPLVSRTRGGRGGGGAALTPQGLELVRRVAEAEESINGGEP
jgi:molybdate transport repressor ModE-like protein/molybdopterin-binding protein